MNDRETLIELIKHIVIPYFAEQIADHLIANGVVIREKGEWMFKHDPIADPKGYFIRIVCPKCNLHTGGKSNFCPNCGADMRGTTHET